MGPADDSRTDTIGGPPSQYDLIEARLEVIDRIQAQLLTGLGELWAGLEALTEFVLDARPEAERTRYAQALTRYQNELWKAVGDSVSRTMGDDAGRPSAAPGGGRDGAHGGGGPSAPPG